MAKYTVDSSYVFQSGRGESESVKDALAWVNGKYVTEGEDGEETPTYTVSDLVVYAVRRLRALNKDGQRVKKGKAPSRIYTSRVAEVKDATKNAKAAKEAAREALARALHITLAKAEKVERAERKPAKRAAKRAATKPARKADTGGARHAL